MLPSLVVSVPGAICQSSQRCVGVPIEIGGLLFLATLVIVDSTNIDVILGMDWLSMHHAMIDCAAKSVTLMHPFGQTTQLLLPYATVEPQPHSQFVEIEDCQSLNIQEIPVECEFPDVFLEELSGIITGCSVQFVAELTSGDVPTSGRPHHMPPEELVELQNQLRESVEQNFAQSSMFSWECSTLFVTKKDTTVSQLASEYCP